MSTSTDDTARVVAEVEAERRRQVQEEGWTHDHDDQHTDRSLAAAAACYAYHASLSNATRGVDELWSTDLRVSIIGWMWPGSWLSRWWKPRDRRRECIIAAALLVAEIERIDRNGK